MHHDGMTGTPSAAPVTTDVLWDSLVGARLEQLLHGLLDAMGAKRLVWRAGADAGVTAADGGRDLEAIFERPTPEGELDRKLWWIEAKGRAGTVPKRDVQDFIVNATARTDIDVLVFCTNTRFSNATRDWVDEWQRSRPHPEVRLWDRDLLATLVRQYPLVVARVVPEALDDSDRLALLTERFFRLGESPTEGDCVYFWSKPDVVRQQPNLESVVSMFVYGERREDLLERPWATLLPDDDVTALRVLVEAFGVLPWLVLGRRPRPLSGTQIVETAAYLTISVVIRLPAEAVLDIATNPLRFLDDGDQMFEELATSDHVLEVWREAMVRPTFARIQDELRDVCADDCVRVSVDPTSAFPPALLGRTYWRRFGIGDLPSDHVLIIENSRRPCAVGLPLEARGTRCPLIDDEFTLTAGFIADLQAVVAFRMEHPDGQFLRMIDE